MSTQGQLVEGQKLASISLTMVALVTYRILRTLFTKLASPSISHTGRSWIPLDPTLEISYTNSTDTSPDEHDARDDVFVATITNSKRLLTVQSKYASVSKEAENNLVIVQPQIATSANPLACISCMSQRLSF